MRLTPKEQEKLMLHMAGNLAKERKERGVKLNYVESLAYISSELLELARDGKTVVELMQLGTKILTKKAYVLWNTFSFPAAQLCAVSHGSGFSAEREWKRK